MRRAAALAAFALLAGCASAPPVPGTTVPDERTAQVVPGRTTKAELLSTLGKTHAVVFDSGYEAWLYDIPSGGGRFAEFVVLIDPQGIVKKTRRRAPSLPGQ
ncbi:MAG: hypothetical protein ACXWC4_00105 [Telluria sp.]